MIFTCWNLDKKILLEFSIRVKTAGAKKFEIKNYVTWLCPCIKRARNICIWRVFPWFNDDDRKSMKEIKYKTMTFFNRPPCFFSIAAKRRWEKTYMGLLGPIITRTYIRILYIGRSQDADTIQGRRKVWKSGWGSNNVVGLPLLNRVNWSAKFLGWGGLLPCTPGSYCPAIRSQLGLRTFHWEHFVSYFGKIMDHNFVDDIHFWSLCKPDLVYVVDKWIHKDFFLRSCPAAICSSRLIQSFNIFVRNKTLYILSCIMQIFLMLLYNGWFFNTHILRFGFL